MSLSPFQISLPIADRVRSYAFYQEALGLTAVGELADDGVPEPLVFQVNDQTRLMLIPSGGFGWVVAENQVATAGTSECMLGISAASPADVDAVIERARAAGASVTTQPAQQPWAYAGTFADPDGHLWMVTSS